MRTLLLVLAAALTAHAQQNARARNLVGLNGMAVFVEDLWADVPPSVMTKSLISSDAEAKLRSAGIKFLNAEGLLREPGHPYLYVNVGVMPTAYSINLELCEFVTLERNPSGKAVTAATWKTVKLGVAPPKVLTESIRKALAEALDEFISDYRWAKSQ